MEVFSVILAGGSGTRFWPISRRNKPKQILNLNGENTFIDEAVSRFNLIVKEENIYILATNGNEDKVRKAISKERNIRYIIEPEAKDTAVCILMASLKLYKEKGDCIICISPSDQHITKKKEFKQAVITAIKCSKKIDSVITIGVKPTFPSTGYGYISCDYSSNVIGCFPVLEFNEKPEISKATEYIKKENCLWNTGIYVFKASVIIESFKRFLPRVYEKIYSCYDSLNTIDEEKKLKEVYKLIQNISIDYGIIERLDKVLVVPTDMGWTDVGTFDSLGCMFPPDENGNVIKGQSVNIDTNNCVIYSDNTLVTTIGIENMIIISSDDTLLICSKSQSQRVREIVDILEKRELHKYM